MAIIKFKDSYDLINYLCREEILGIVEVEYSQLRSTMLEASGFNFIYPDLEEHLDMVIWDFIEYNGAIGSSIQIEFYNAEDFALDGTDDHEYDPVKKEFDKLMNRFLGPDAFAYITLEGSDYSLEATRIKKWDFGEFIPNGERKLHLWPEQEKAILNGIFEILKEHNRVIECPEEYEFMVENDNVHFLEKGGLMANGFPSLKDDKPFELDTDQLNKTQ